VRRERDASRRSSVAAGPDGIARRIVREALDLTGAPDAELWGSKLLGVFWGQRGTLPLAEPTSDEYSLVFGEPLIEAVARLGGAGPRIALAVIAGVDDGELGARAGELADGLTDAGGDALPSWIVELGEAEITGAAVMREGIFDDASTVFLEARHPGGGFMYRGS
jgi:hypothetical protein